ncbi:Ig-like domain-containing protein, partial [Pseudomonas sp. GD03691]|uniref:Ig-like domain-containing protein n=1 Tax=Pseudomonas sp. GD03691 TaxID=2975367 RepID=UPI0024494645
MASETIGLIAVTEHAAKKIALRTGGKIKAQAGTQYLLQVENTQVAPENVTVKRVGKDLLVSFEGSDKPDLTLQDFFAEGMDSQLFGVAEDNQLHAYVRTDGEGFYGQLMLADGEMAPIALGGPALGTAPLVSDIEDSKGFLLWPLLAGAAVIGAVAASQKHDDHHRVHVPADPSIDRVINNNDPAQPLDVAKDGLTNDSTPVIVGSSEANTIVHVYDHGVELGSTTAAADGSWSFEVPADKALADGSHDFTAIAETPAGTRSGPSNDYPIHVDSLPPSAQLTIDVVAGDDILNLAESQTSQTVSGKATGEFLAGDIVSFTLNGHVYSAAVSASGDWSVEVAGADLAAETTIHATLVAHDAAGNSASVVADHPYSVDLDPPVATLAIDVVAGDDILNLAESKTSHIISGKATGEFLAGDLVTFSLNGTEYSAAVNAVGDWSVSVAGSDLAAETTIHATLVAHDAAGNSASVVADHPYSVDLDPPVATLTIEVVAGDDVVNLDESKVNQTISGKASGEFLAGDLVTFSLNGTEYSAAVNASGDWNVEVAGADLAAETTIHATLVAHDEAGNSASVVADHPYSVDLDPPVATLTIDVVAGDDILNLAESKISQTISGKAGGEFLAGDIVSFTLNGHAYSAAVSGSGEWSVSVAGSDLAKETTIHATLVAHDVAGNSASVVADHPYSVDLDPPVATLTIDVVAGDDILNLAESKTSQIISGKAGGEFLAGDIVSFTLNGHAYSAAVSGSGDWSVSVAGSDLAKETTIHATLVAHDVAGNSANAVADHPYSVDLDPPVATLTIDVVAGDDILNLAESKTSQTISGKAGGEFLAGDLVTFRLNGTEYSAAVNASGAWSVSVAGSDLAKETTIHATLVAHDAAGNSTNVVADHPYSVDLDPPVATLTINVVAGDDIVNLDESKVNQTISGKATGEFKAGDIVSFKLDGTTYSAAVAANGDWSVEVPGSKLVAETSHKIDATLVAHDAAGNVGNITASHAYSVITDPGTTTLTIDIVAGDDIVNLAESKTNQTISGKVVGTYLAGDKVTFTLNGHAYSASVATDGKWSVSVPGSDLVGDSARSINATVIGHDTAGNASTASASHPYSVEITPPTATLTINVVAGDDVVNLNESLQNHTITGGSSGARAGDIVSIVTDGTTYSTTVNASGNWSIAGVPGSKLVADADHVIDGRIIASDAAGNTSEATATHAYAVHTAVPDIYLYIDKITGDDIIDASEAATSQPITGTTTGTNPGDVLKLTLNGVVYSTTVNASGAWSVTVPGSELVADANHRVAAEVKSTDQWGNSATTTASHNYVVEILSTKPTIDEIFDDVGLITGPIARGGITDDSKPDLSGTADANSTVAIYDNGGKIGSTTADGNGQWTFTPTTPLSEGKHDFTVDATNAAGSTSDKSDVFTIITDYAPPVATLSIDVIAGNDLINYAKSQTEQTVSGKAGGEFTSGDVVSFSLNGHAYSAAVNASGTWSVAVAGGDLAAADNIQATLVAHNAAGNSTNVVANHGYNVDLVSTTPVITSVYDAVGDKQGNLVP